MVSVGPRRGGGRDILCDRAVRFFAPQEDGQRGRGAGEHRRGGHVLMNVRAGMLTRVVAIVPVVIVMAAAACVRFDAPTWFACTASSECPDGETCVNGSCLAQGE